MSAAERRISSLRRLSVPLAILGLVLVALTVASDSPPEARADFNEADPVQGSVATVAVDIQAPSPTPTPTPAPTPAPGACGFDPLTTSSLSDSTAGASADITITFDLLAPDCYYDTLVSFIPPEFGVAADAYVADGAIVAELRAKVTLGLIGNACNNTINVKFAMMDATTDTSNVMADAFKDLNWDNIPDMLEDRDDDGLPDAVTSYPDFLTRIFPGVTPRARLHGQTSVSGVVTSLSMLIFEPGTVLNTPAGTITPDPSLGYPSVYILQSMGDPDVSPVASAITDFCAPLETAVTTFGITRDNLCTDDGPTPPVCSPIGDFIEGVPGPGGTSPDESGVVYRTNPIVAGAYTPTWFAVSQRDADGDGYENRLDPCPFDPDPSWNPRTGSFGTPQTGDSDGDRIPDVCDQSPNDSFPPSIDVDGDFYLNSGDNCPQVTNGANPRIGEVIGPNNQRDSDLDGIGDECDPNPNTPDGEALAVCSVSLVDIGGGGTPAVDPQTVQPCDPNAPLPSVCADVNNDGKVSGRDVSVVARAILSHPASRRWDPAADLNNDGWVDLLDLVIVTSSLVDKECR